MSRKFSSPYQLMTCSYKLPLILGTSDFQVQSLTSLNGEGAL